MILLNEKESSNFNSLQQQSYESYNQNRVFQLFQCLEKTTSMAEYHPIIQYLVALPRYSKQAYSFNDFWVQIEELITNMHSNVTIQKNIKDTFRVPYAQWILSLISFVISYFKLERSNLNVYCTEPSIVESQNMCILDANHIVEISFTTKHIPPVPNLIQQLFHFGLIGTGVDIGFMYNDVDWKCHILMEVKAPEQPLIINSQKIHQPSEQTEKKTILIVDDDQYNTQTLEVLFHSDGFRTISASQGQQALRLIDSVDLIDIIILDLRMPILDGFGVLQKIKKCPMQNQFPLLFYQPILHPMYLNNFDNLMLMPSLKNHLIWTTSLAM